MLKKSQHLKTRLLSSAGLTRHDFYPYIAGAGMAALLLVGVPGSAKAFNLYNGQDYNNNLVIDLNTTLSYTPIFRADGTNDKLVSPTLNANGSEGDLDFRHGLVSNELEVLPVLDIKDGNYGAHFSAEGYLNSSFLGTNQNNQPLTLNPYSIAKSNDFTSATRNVEGLNARMLDAFVYGSGSFGADDSQNLEIKVGRQTLIWGQDLFLANNGIEAGMVPFDTITANNNPNAQTQQIILPVGQVVVTYQPNQVLTIQSYYQFQWEHDQLQGVGSYFNTTDILDAGGQRLIFDNPGTLFPGAPGVYAFRTKDITPPSQNGQFGTSAQLTLGNYDVGFYGLRYDSKGPTLYLNVGNPSGINGHGISAGTYNLVYPRDIWIEGASVSTTVGPANVAGEISFRQHMNLTTGANESVTNNANGDPAYPVGDTWAGQVSAIYLSPGMKYIEGGITADGEIGFNHVLKVTQNQGLITSAATGALNRTSTAANMELVVTPNYYDVLPSLNLGFPIGIAYNIYGRSMVDSTENHGTGSVNFGVTATYRTTWIASLTYQDYIGRAQPLLAGEPSAADRNFVLLNFQHTF
jgi:hypothetical protein